MISCWVLLLLNPSHPIRIMSSTTCRSLLAPDYVPASLCAFDLSSDTIITTQRHVKLDLGCQPSSLDCPTWGRRTCPCSANAQYVGNRHMDWRLVIMSNYSNRSCQINEYNLLWMASKGLFKRRRLVKFTILTFPPHHMTVPKPYQKLALEDW